MPIEFRCPTCQSLIRTPDGSSGKQARCPKCSSTVVIPAASAPDPLPSQASFPPNQPTSPFPSSSPAPLAPLSPFAPSQPFQPTPQSPFQPKPAANPFGESSASPFPNAGPINPYASPGSAYAPSTQALTPELARRKLLGPAIGLAISAVLPLLYGIFTLLLLVVAPQQFMKDAPPIGQDAERAGFFFGLIGVLTVMIVVPLIIGLGTIPMFRGRGRGLALTGAIAAVLPCNLCLLFSIPFGIWALVVLNQADVRAAMR